MIEQDTVKLLRECDAGIKMGVTSIGEVLPYVHSEGLRELLRRGQREHEVLSGELETLLAKYRDEGKNPNPVAKGMSSLKTNAKLAFDASDATIANRIKTYHTVGNHDDDGNSHEETLAAYRLARGYYHFDRGGFRFVVTDTNNCLMDGKWVHYSNSNYYAVGRKSGSLITRVPPEQLEWLKATIESSPYPCIVTSHASYEREDGSPDRVAVRKIFDDANAKHPGRVRLVINGHHHCDHVRILENIVYLDLNSASYDWMVKTHTAYPEEDVKRWKHARHLIAWNDPVSAIITINRNGHLKVEGQRSEFYRGVTPVMAGLPATNGRQNRLITPNIQSFEMTMSY